MSWSSVRDEANGESCRESSFFLAFSSPAVHTYLNSKIYIYIMDYHGDGRNYGAILSYTPGHHVGITNSYFGLEWGG